MTEEESSNYISGALTSAIQSTFSNTNGKDLQREEWLDEIEIEEHFEDIPFSTFESNTQNQIQHSDVNNNKSLDISSMQTVVTPIKVKGSAFKDNSPKSDVPLTPTTNLKVLLHAASPEIRNYERRKKLFNSSLTMLNQHSELTTISEQQDFNYDKSIGNNNVKQTVTEITNVIDSQKTNYNKENIENQCPKVKIVNSYQKKTTVNSRKEKSLGLLCQRFLKLFPEYPQECISMCLDQAAKNLVVGRRRIYDIINVLESIKIVKRLAKSNYLWRGRIGLDRTLANIRKVAEESGLADKLRSNFHLLSNYRAAINIDDVEPQPDNNCDSESSQKRRDKSLGILSHQFVTLLVVQPDQEVSLDMAARVLITNGNPNENKYKTKVRRLYDIANILTSLKLIGKVHCQGRRPTFSWIGVDETVAQHSSDDTSAGEFLADKQPLNSESDQENPGLNSLCQVVEKERRDLCLTTPNKNHSFVIATPGKKGSFVIVTPVKSSNESDGLNSSFNSDEIFQQELESLRKRFPSPMSRLLSACNVQEALSNHKAKKIKERNCKEPIKESNNQKWKDAVDSFSTDKLSLSYLEQQQKQISKTVDGIFMNNKLGLEQSNGNGMRKLYTNPIIEIKQPPTNQPLKTIVCNDGRVLVPVSNLQFMNSQGFSKTPMLLPIIKPKNESTLLKTKREGIVETKKSPTLINIQALGKKDSSLSQVDMVNSIRCQVVPKSHCVKSLEVKSSGLGPIQTNLDIPENKRTHFTISADGVTSTQPKKFIKLDFNLKPFQRANSEPIIKTYKPILKNLSNQHNFGKIQKISTGKNVGSVVTNLFSRLEKETNSQGGSKNFKQININECNSLKLSGARRAAVPLQPLLNLATNCNFQNLRGKSPAKIKRNKNAPRKLKMGDENTNFEIMALRDPSKKIFVQQ